MSPKKRPSKVSKSAEKSANGKAVRGRPFTGADDPRSGRGPARGAANAGRPPAWFRAKMAELVTKDQVINFIAQCLTKPTLEVRCKNKKCKRVVHVYDPDLFFKALDRATDRWLGKPKQELGAVGGGPLAAAVIYLPEQDKE